MTNANDRTMINRFKEKDFFYKNGKIKQAYSDAKLVVEDSEINLQYHGTTIVTRLKDGYLINGDNWIGQFNDIRNFAIRELKPNIQIPFSALKHVTKEYNKIKIIDSNGDEYEHRNLILNKNTITCKQQNALEMIVKHFCENSAYYQCEEFDYNQISGVTEDENNYYLTLAIHHLRAVVFYYKRKYYLSTGRDREYFLCQLPSKVSKISEAYELLKPVVLKYLIDANTKVKIKDNLYRLCNKKLINSILKNAN